MNAIDRIKAAQHENFVDEDGEPLDIEIKPSLSPAQIGELEREVGLGLPRELKDLLGYCSGIEGLLLDGIDFTGATMSFEQREVFPNGLPIAADGSGNFWVLDITPTTSEVAPVFYACHDAPVILYQSADLASFVTEILRQSVPPHRSLVQEVSDDSLFRVWRENPGVLEQAQAIASPSATLSSFARSLSPDFQIIDLRGVAPGMGFSWGRYGPRTEIRRHGYERIFAYKKRERSFAAMVKEMGLGR